MPVGQSAQVSPWVGNLAAPPLFGMLGAKDTTNATCDLRPATCDLRLTTYDLRSRMYNDKLIHQHEPCHKSTMRQ